MNWTDADVRKLHEIIQRQDSIIVALDVALKNMRGEIDTALAIITPKRLERENVVDVPEDEIRF